MTSPQSMRFSLHEVLSGMLATLTTDSFPAEPERLAAIFEDLAGRFPLFAPMANAVDPAAVAGALSALEQKGFIERVDGRYALTTAGRAHCVTGKRTLFSASDREQLEAAALVFDAGNAPGT